MDQSEIFPWKQTEDRLTKNVPSMPLSRMWNLAANRPKESLAVSPAAAIGVNLLDPSVQTGGRTWSPFLRYSPGVRPVCFLKALTKAATDAKPAASAIARSLSLLERSRVAAA